MNSGRIAPVVGLLICGAAALWWLASSATPDGGGADPVRLAAKLLAALFAARLLAIAALGPALGWDARPAVAIPALASLAAIAWPLVLIGACAGGSSGTAAILAEAALLIVALAVVGLGRVLRRIGRTDDNAAIPAATGVVVAAALWGARDTWLAWLTP